MSYWTTLKKLGYSIQMGTPDEKGKMTSQICKDGVVVAVLDEHITFEVAVHHAEKFAKSELEWLKKNGRPASADRVV